MSCAGSRPAPAARGRISPSYRRAPIPSPTILNLAVALGIGLLIGAERERRKARQAAHGVAGIRTFALAALAGAVSLMTGGPVLLAVTTAIAGGLVAAAYWLTPDREDPGMTTETALILTLLLGALAMREPALAAGLGAVGVILLAARTPLHRFVSQTLTEAEVRDGLVLAGASLIVLPLLPDRAMGPYAALNPHAIWLVVILVLVIGAAGHVAIRTLGARFGLAVAGFSGGFISSAATIGAMGARARLAPDLMPAAAAGAVLSTVATVAQMAALLGAVSLPTLRAMATPLACAGAAAVAYGAAVTAIALRRPSRDGYDPGKAFSLTTALLFALVVSAVMLISAGLSQSYGGRGVLAAAGVAGLADTHAAAVSVASLAAAGRLTPGEAVTPILAALTANTLSKTLVAWTAGSRAFALAVTPGLLLVAAAAWLGARLL